MSIALLSVVKDIDPCNNLQDRKVKRKIITNSAIFTVNWCQ